MQLVTTPPAAAPATPPAPEVVACDPSAALPAAISAPPKKAPARPAAAQGVLQADGPDQMVKTYRAAMDEGRHTVDPVLTNFKSKFAVDWMPYLNKKWTDAADTAIRAEASMRAERLPLEYVRKEEYRTDIAEIKRLLERIESKVDRKQDRTDSQASVRPVAPGTWRDGRDMTR